MAFMQNKAQQQKGESKTWEQKLVLVMSNFAQQNVTSVIQLIKLLLSNKHSYVVNNSNFICVLILLWAKCRELLL